jgi:hypothetical protein
MPTKIRLGNEIEDIVSKVRGIAHGHVEYLDGTKHWIMQPQAIDGVKQAELYVPVEYCRYVGEGVLVLPPKKVLGFHAAELKE